LQQFQGLKKQGPEERVEAGLGRLAVGVEDPEGGVDTDPEGIRASRGRAGCRRGVESFEGEAGDGDGLGGTFEDLRKARWIRKTSCLPKVRVVWLTSQSPATPIVARESQWLQ